MIDLRLIRTCFIFPLKMRTSVMSSRSYTIWLDAYDVASELELILDSLFSFVALDKIFCKNIKFCCNKFRKNSSRVKKPISECLY